MKRRGGFRHKAKQDKGTHMFNMMMGGSGANQLASAATNWGSSNDNQSQSTFMDMVKEMDADKG